MTKKYYVNEMAMYDYSEIQLKNPNERYTPLRNNEVVNLLNQQNQKIEKLVAKEHNFCFDYTENYNNVEGNTLHLIDKYTKINMDGNKIHIIITPPNSGPLEFIYYITGVTFAQSMYENKKEEIKKLLQMKDFLKDMGIDSRINKYDKRLYILQVKNIEDEIKITNKASDLGLVFVKEREPQYGPIDPFSLTREIIGFKEEYYIKCKGDIND